MTTSRSLVQVKNLSCEICGPEKKLTGFLNDDYNDFVYKNEDGTNGWMYNIDCNYHALVCRHCGRFYMTCPQCSGNLQFRTYEEQENVYVSLCQFINCGDTRANLEDPDDVVDELVIDFTDRNVNYVKNEDIECITGDKMTGPDGGNYLVWKCRKCNRKYTSSDK